MKREKTDHGIAFEIVKANIIAIIISLALILIAALAIKLFNVSDGAIPIINQIIKGVSVFTACLISMRRPNNGWLRGLVIGLIYVIFSYLLFSLMDGEFTFGLTLLNDVALGCVSGMISGIIAVNVRKKSV